MKIITGFVIVFLVGIFTSCDPAFGINTMGYTRKQNDVNSSWNYVASNFNYIPNLDINNVHWKSPKEFERDGGGACQDFASYLMYQIGVNAEIVIIKVKKNSEYASMITTPYHCIVRIYGDMYIEPQVYNMYWHHNDFQIEEVYDYNTVMKDITHWGTASISFTE